MQFDQSQMPDLEFERLLLWSGQFHLFFTQAHDAELTAEVYRRAAQLRKEPKHKQTPYEVPVVRMAEMGVVE